MFTKSLTHQTLTTHDLSADVSAINRLLLAAAISPSFRAGLLQNPAHAVLSGFGGEKFQISESTLNIMSSIHVSSLPEFIQQLDKNLSHKLLAAKINNI
jgi:hypothetical protein